ncbi:PQQ-dependent sugar dehydrogenase [Phenylobacterium terrae]|uniref:PQQ-dependent sugar dehydrogenase n=1 Tax=Phenylobacterium terrae TaxID=2665495 RepID=A0ABW4N2R1_9CAUL
MRRLIFAGLAAGLAAACGPGDAQTPATPKAAQTGGPLETRPANADFLKPAFAGQTRAPEMKANVAYDVVTVAEGLEKPWGVAFLPDGRMLVTEKPGRLRIVAADGQLSPPVAGLPAVDARGQGGLLGLALDPDFRNNGLIYWAYAEGHEGGMTNTAVARGRLTDGAQPRVENVQVIYRQAPQLASTMHYGGRLVFARDGTLFVTLGERSILPGRRQAQQMDSALGKIVRINPDGSIPRDNPFVDRQGARPEIYAIGNRNVQAAALHPQTGKLWVVDHGPKGGDEINIIEAGKDYGWPTITYGVEYSGPKIGEGIAQKEGMEQPIYYWDPVIAPSGMAFYQAGLFPEWRGSLLVGGLGGKHVARLALDGERVIGEERLLTDLEERIRDVVVGPDGAVYVATDNAKGRVLKLVPRR